MNKYRVLKAYPKQITNSGRLVTLQAGTNVYLKEEAQVLRLVNLGFLKPIVEVIKREVQPKVESKKPAKHEHQNTSRSEYLNKKNKSE